MTREQELEALLRDTVRYIEDDTTTPGMMARLTIRIKAILAEPASRVNRVRPSYLSQESLDRAKAAGEQRLLDRIKAEPAPAQDDDEYMPEGIAEALMHSEVMDIPAMAANALRMQLTAPAQDEREATIADIFEVLTGHRDQVAWSDTVYSAHAANLYEAGFRKHRRAQTEQQPIVVPEGWLIELGFDVLDRPFRFVDSKSHTPTIKVVLPPCEPDDSSSWDLRDEIARRIGSVLIAPNQEDPSDNRR